MSDAYDRDGRLRTRDDVWELLLPGGLRRELSAVRYVREWREMMARASRLDRALHLLLTMIFFGGLALCAMSSAAMGQDARARLEDDRRTTDAINGVRRELANQIATHAHQDYPTRDELQPLALAIVSGLLTLGAAVGGLAHKANMRGLASLTDEVRAVATSHHALELTVGGLCTRNEMDHTLLKQLVVSTDESMEATRELVELTKRRRSADGGDI